MVVLFVFKAILHSSLLSSHLPSCDRQESYNVPLETWSLLLLFIGPTLWRPLNRDLYFVKNRSTSLYTLNTGRRGTLKSLRLKIQSFYPSYAHKICAVSCMVACSWGCAVWLIRIRVKIRFRKRYQILTLKKTCNISKYVRYFIKWYTKLFHMLKLFLL